jgi:DNA-directed RNA polymerase specialized sigma24 family protein
MDIQTLKRWRALELNKISSAESVARLESEMERMTSRYTASTGGAYADSSKIPGQLARLEELRDKHAALVVESETFLIEISDWLKILTAEERQLIELRYHSGWSWLRISMKMNYSKATLFRIHERAIRK